MSVPPIKFSYWIIHGSLVAGPAPATPDYDETTKELTKVLQAGVDVFIDLRKTTESGFIQFVDYEKRAKELVLKLNKTVEYEIYQIPDGDAPNPSGIDIITTSIQNWVTAGKMVYVHCHGGHGRTGTIIACYLLRTGVCKTTDDAINELNRLRKESDRRLELFRAPQTPRQIEAIGSYEQFLRENKIL